MAHTLDGCHQFLTQRLVSVLLCVLEILLGLILKRLVFLHQFLQFGLPLLADRRCESALTIEKSLVFGIELILHAFHLSVVFCLQISNRASGLCIARHRL